MTFNHKSVLLNEVIESLNIKADGYYVDGTLGGGGHALEVVKRLESGKLIGIDRDSDAIKAATQRLNDYINNVIIIRDNYVNIENILKRENIDKVDGIYIDLGVSSYQLDTAERGFTYRFDAPLDMRPCEEPSILIYAGCAIFTPLKKIFIIVSNVNFYFT